MEITKRNLYTLYNKQFTNYKTKVYLYIYAQLNVTEKNEYHVICTMRYSISNNTYGIMGLQFAKLKFLKSD